MKINDYGYDEIKVGEVFEFKRVISEKDIDNFAKLTGDFNPMHTDEKYASGTIFKGRIVHGMLAASLFSALLGMVCPGKRNLYLSQSLNFRKPIKPGSEVVVKGSVVGKADSVKIITIKTEIICNGAVAVDGEAKVRVV